MPKGVSKINLFDSMVIDLHKLCVTASCTLMIIFPIGDYEKPEVMGQCGMK